jgi:hypothetical protein
MRGAPHSGFATLISRMSWRISSGVLGRPPRGLRIERTRCARVAARRRRGITRWAASRTLSLCNEYGLKRYFISLCHAEFKFFITLGKIVDIFNDGVNECLEVLRILARYLLIACVRSYVSKGA